MKLPDTRTFHSKDKRRVATYGPLRPGDAVPPGLERRRPPIYRLSRTVRTRRGFGTIVHTLTTYKSNKKAVHASAVHWVRVKTSDR